MKKLRQQSWLMKILLVLLVCIIPLLIAYEAYQLVQSSSSYKVNNIKVAVVNEDRPTEQNNRHWDVGGQLVNKLRDDKKSNVHWHFVSENEADRELSNGDVDMAVIIPTDLSINASSALGPNPRISNLKIKMAKHNNFLSVQVNQQIANDVKQNVAENVQAVYAKILLNDIKDMGNQMKLASKGSSQVNGNVLTVKSGKVSVSRNLDALTNQMLNFQDGAKSIDGKINKNSEMLSNQLNENSQKFSSQLQSTTQDFNSSLNSSKQNTASQINKLSGNFDNQINTLSSGIDTLTINNKKINVNLGYVKDGSDAVGGNLKDLNSSSSNTDKSVNDYTKQFGKLNQQLAGISKQTNDLNSNSQDDQKTINVTNEFVKSSSDLIDQVVLLKAVDISGLDKLSNDQSATTSLKDKAKEISDNATQILNDNGTISSNDSSALATLNNLGQDSTISDDAKKNIASVQDNIKGNEVPLSDQKTKAATINADSQMISDNIGTISDQVATINKLLPILKNIDSSKLVNKDNGSQNQKDSEGQIEAQELIKALPHVAETLKSIQGLNDESSQSVKDSSSLAGSSDNVNSSVSGLNDSVKAINSKYSGLNSQIGSTKDSSDSVVNEGQLLASDVKTDKDNKNSAVNGATQSSEQNNQALADDLQKGLGNLKTGLDTYKGFDPSSMNQSMTDQVSEAEKKNNDQLANAADSARETSQKASDNDNKIRDALGDLIDNNKHLNNLLTENANKVVPISTNQNNVNSIINPVNNNVSGKGYGAALNKLFAPTIIAVVLYIGALLTYMLKIYSQRHKKINISKKLIVFIAIVQAVGVDLLSVYFNVQPSNVVLLLLISVVTSLSFNGISIAMNKLMKLSGLILMVVLLAVQIVISNNVLPADALGIFNKVAFLLPLTYGVKALNDVINSFLYTPALTVDMVALISYPIILFVIIFIVEKIKKRKEMEKD